MSVYNKNGSELSSVFSKDGAALSSAYDLQGNQIFGGEVDYSEFSVSNYCSVQISQMQGFDIWGDYIFQFRANSSNVNNVMCTINRENGIVQNNIQATSDHGDSATFSNEYYSVNDDFPLIYVTADTNPCKIYLNRVTLNSSERIRTYQFPIAQAGYYGAATLNKANNIIYIVGYSENNYLTDNNGSNKVVVSKWDLSSISDNGDGTYTPAYISSFMRPFIYVMQGLQFHDNMIWIASGYTNAHSYIYAISPQDGELLHTIDLNTTEEVEGLSFIDAFNMVVGLYGGNYKLYSFEEIST